MRNKNVEAELAKEKKMIFGTFKLKQPEPAKNDKKRKRALNRPPPGRGPSQVTNGRRKADVRPTTMKKRPKEFPGEGLRILSGQL
jgi:hypothetical protein